MVVDAEGGIGETRNGVASDVDAAFVKEARRRRDERCAANEAARCWRAVGDGREPGAQRAAAVRAAAERAPARCARASASDGGAAGNAGGGARAGGDAAATSGHAPSKSHRYKASQNDSYATNAPGGASGGGAKWLASPSIARSSTKSRWSPHERSAARNGSFGKTPVLVASLRRRRKRTVAASAKPTQRRARPQRSAWHERSTAPAPSTAAAHAAPSARGAPRTAPARRARRRRERVPRPHSPRPPGRRRGVKRAVDANRRRCADARATARRPRGGFGLAVVAAPRGRHRGGGVGGRRGYAPPPGGRLDGALEVARDERDKAIVRDDAVGGGRGEERRRARERAHVDTTVAQAQRQAREAACRVRAAAAVGDESPATASASARATAASAGSPFSVATWQRAGGAARRASSAAVTASTAPRRRP